STGSLDFEFDATGVRGGCDPTARPAFVTSPSAPGEPEAKRAGAEAAKQRTRKPSAGASRAGETRSGTSPSGDAAATEPPGGSDAGTPEAGGEAGEAPEAPQETIVAPPASGDYAD